MPRFNQSIAQGGNHIFGMARCWRDAQTLRALWHGWIIDGLDINIVLFQEPVAGGLAKHRVANHQWNDVCARGHHWKAGCAEELFGCSNGPLLALAFGIGHFEMADGCRCCSCNRWRKRGCENERWRIRAYGVDHARCAGDVAAKCAKRFGERALNNVNAIQKPFLLGNAAAAGAVHADGVHLIKIGECVVFIGKIAEFSDRRNIAIHGVNAFESNDFRPLDGKFSQQITQVRHVIVTEDLLRRTGTAHAVDHGSMVEFIGKDDAVRQHFGNRRNAGQI